MKNLLCLFGMAITLFIFSTSAFGQDNISERLKTLEDMVKNQQKIIEELKEEIAKHKYWELLKNSQGAKQANQTSQLTDQYLMNQKVQQAIRNRNRQTRNFSKK